jgi:hypothetical protein
VPKKSKGRAGNTIPVTAAKLGMGQGQLRRAIEKGEVKYVEFAGLKRIPDAEIERIAALLGLSISDPVEVRGPEAASVAEAADPAEEKIAQPTKAGPKPAPRGTKATKSARAEANA